MKRGKPMKRTPLKRGESQLKRTPLKRGDSEMKRTPLKPRSKKMKEVYVTRRKIVEEMLAEEPYCSGCGIWAGFDNNTHPLLRMTQDIHELINRSQGGSILERQNLFALCRTCHRRVTDNPKDAETVGLHLPSWANNDMHYMEAERVRHSWFTGNKTKPFWMEDNDE